MTRTCLPRRPPALLTSSTAISMPFLVEIPNVAVVPVNEPYSPITISETESDFAPVHDTNTRAPKKTKTSSHGLRLMNPPSGGYLKVPQFSIMVFCSYFVVLDHGRARQPPCRAPAWSVVVLLTRLLWRL